MLLQWKSFKIDLSSFSDYLRANIIDADGIIASDDNFEIIEKISFSQEDIDNVNSYYASLTEDGEQNKLNALNLPTVQPLPSYNSNQAAKDANLPIGAFYQKNGVVYTVC